MKCKGSVSVIIKPRFMSTFSRYTEALVVPKVTLYKPSLLPRDNWPHLKELELADPKYFQARQIDLLLGAAVHARVVEGRVVKGEANHPIAMATALSWILSEPSLPEEKIPTLKRWQMVQQMLQHYWRRWSREYLQSLQQRQKWATSTPNIKAGDLVIACNDNTPPARWQLARVIEVHPGDNGYVRAVTIQTANAVLKRPVNNLIILK
ncbi:uncharacterized protein LOC124171707 isoform X2 [Ischnura elegans]|uniref:uncharacterized protein LOC124171707 isoform X2 n=1 Tax=Ischnura elegans TaxID=197161 RepID=UPI001ED8A975|nr:uncharacterized protein LOC124171707 isoform X2 [Ischnura elegans]